MPTLRELAKTERRLLELIDGNINKRIALSNIVSLFQSKYAQALHCKALGIANLSDLANVFPSVRLQNDQSNNQAYLVRVEKKADVSASVPRTEEERFLLLIDSSPNKKLSFSLVHDKYKSKFGKNLDIKALGFSKLKKMIESFPSIKINTSKDPFLTRLSIPACAPAPSRASSCSAAVQSITLDVNAEAVNIAGIHVIDTAIKMDQLRRKFPFHNLAYTTAPATTKPDSGDSVVALDCHGVPGDLIIIQLATHDETFVFDCLQLGAVNVGDFLQNMMANAGVIKLVHDLYSKVALTSLRNDGNLEVRGMFDMQLAMEYSHDDIHMAFHKMMKELRQPDKIQAAQQNGTKRKSEVSGKQFAQRPLPHHLLRFAADAGRQVLDARETIWNLLGKKEWSSIQRASDARMRSIIKTGTVRQICFDASRSYKVSSRELLVEMRPNDIFKSSPLEVSNEASILIDMLPDDVARFLKGRTHDLYEIVLDKGRNPSAWVGKDRLVIGADENRLVDLTEINAIVKKLGGFGRDNRAGLERQLHRISAMRNRENVIIGLTMRVGRHVSGNAYIISDLLYSYPHASILFLGEPGSGKYETAYFAKESTFPSNTRRSHVHLICIA